MFEEKLSIRGVPGVLLICTTCLSGCSLESNTPSLSVSIKCVPCTVRSPGAVEGVGVAAKLETGTRRFLINSGLPSGLLRELHSSWKLAGLIVKPVTGKEVFEGPVVN